MNKNLTTKQNTDLVLKKSKITLGISHRILSGKTSLTAEIDESWMERLWKWAEENNIPDYKWIKNDYYVAGGSYYGLPKNKKDLFSFKELDIFMLGVKELPKEIGNLRNLTLLNLSCNELTELPKEIGNLTNLTELDLSGNQLTELPKEIRNLTNLTELTLELNSDLILTYEQKKWIKGLKENGCKINNLFDRKININEDETPF